MKYVLFVYEKKITITVGENYFATAYFLPTRTKEQQ